MKDIYPEHLSPDTVEDYFRAGVPTAFVLSPALEASLEIDPAHQELRLLCRASGGSPEVTSFERISVSRGPLAGRAGEWFVLTIDATNIHYEAYVLVESVVDQLRAGASFRHAVSESVVQLKGLLAFRKRISEEREIGLIGELLVLRAVIAKEGQDRALVSWLGPAGEEHDFGFMDFDAEVKTTRSEERTHRVGSETQLEPQPGRPLYLVSIQITLAGEADQGFSLGTLVSELRSGLDSSRQAFDTALESLGWFDRDADLYFSRFLQRSKARAYLVDSDFPAITGPRLDQTVPQRSLVSSVSYIVDVTSLIPSRVPHPLNDLCEAQL